MKTTMHILEISGYYLCFKSISAATAAMTALSKGTQLVPDSDHRDYVIPSEEDQRFHSRMRLYSGKVSQPKKTKTKKP